MANNNMMKMMKQVQQMQAKMMELQEELGEKTVEATSGGGMVKAVASGKKEIIELHIDPNVLDPEDVEMLQDLVVAAVNEALRKADTMASEEMKKISAGMNLPPGLL